MFAGCSILIQQGDGSGAFYKSWSEMKVGFNESENYWIGNDRLHALTSSGSRKLRIDLFKNGSHHTAEYSKFTVGSESTGYALRQGGYDGTAGDCLIYNEALPFSTYDGGPSRDCANKNQGSWWYSRCTFAGMNNKINHQDGFTWHCDMSVFGDGWTDDDQLSTTQMWLCD